MPRLYTTLNASDLETLVMSGRCHPAAAFGVNQQVRALLPEGDDEECEHLVTQLAAAASRTDPVTVGVFDVGDTVATPVVEGHAPLGLFELTTDLEHRHLVCFLVGDPGERVQEDADLELSWYDASEIAQVTALL